MSAQYSEDDRFDYHVAGGPSAPPYTPMLFYNVDNEPDFDWETPEHIHSHTDAPYTPSTYFLDSPRSSASIPFLSLPDDCTNGHGESIPFRAHAQEHHQQNATMQSVDPQHIFRATTHGESASTSRSASYSSAAGRSFNGSTLNSPGLPLDSPFMPTDTFGFNMSTYPHARGHDQVRLHPFQAQEMRLYDPEPLPNQGWNPADYDHTLPQLPSQRSSVVTPVPSDPAPPLKSSPPSRVNHASKPATERRPEPAKSKSTLRPGSLHVQDTKDAAIKSSLQASEAPKASSNDPATSDRLCYECKPPCPFPTRRKLKEHALTHSGVRQVHMCDTCPLSFKRLADLTRHTKSVHCQIRPDICDQCNRDFKRKDSLTRHQLHSCPYRIRGPTDTGPPPRPRLGPDGLPQLLSSTGPLPSADPSSSLSAVKRSSPPFPSAAVKRSSPSSSSDDGDSTSSYDGDTTEKQKKKRVRGKGKEKRREKMEESDEQEGKSGAYGFVPWYTPHDTMEE